MNTRRLLERVKVKAAAERRRLVARAAYRQPDGRSPYPEEMIFFLTYRCNLRCQMCGQWREGGYVRDGADEMLRDELDLPALLSVVDQVAGFRPMITLCGGEVLLYRGWDAFLERAKARGLRCQIITNGVLLAEAAERIAGLGVNTVVVSLDGPAELHDRVRGVQGAFARAADGIEALRRLRPQSGPPKIWINTTISAANHARLGEMLDIAGNLGGDALFFQHLYFVRPEEMARQNEVFLSRFGCRSTDWEGYVFEPEGLDPARLAEEIERLRAASPGFPVGFIPEFSKEEILRYYGPGEFQPDRLARACVGPWRSLYILPNGDVSPCSSFVAGNLKSQSFKEIWNGERFRLFRSTLREMGGRFPVCARCCVLYRY